MTKVKQSLWSVHLAVLLLGVTGLFSKLIPLNALDITFGRSLVACVCLLVIVKLGGGRLRLNSLKDYGIAVVLGTIMAAHWVTYFASMQYASVSVGMISLFTFPVITVLLEPLFEKTRIVWQDLVSVTVVIIGIFLIVPEINLGNDITLGIALGVISAILYSFRNLMHRKWFNHYSGQQAMGYQTLVITLCLFFFTCEHLYQASSEVWMNVLILGTVCTALPHAMIAFTLIHLRAKTFSLIACMQPFYGVIFAMLVLGESPTWQTYLGGSLVILAALYETINTNKLQQSR